MGSAGTPSSEYFPVFPYRIVKCMDKIGDRLKN